MCSCHSTKRHLSLAGVAAIKHIFNELHYEMTRKIADGGMGVVYEAQQLGSGNFRKVVAVKLIREEYSAIEEDRKSTRLNSSHGYISYAVFCLKKKNTSDDHQPER